MASNPNKADAQLADATGDPIIGQAADHFADLALAYTTDDPGQTAADTITIADGDSGLVEAEVEQALLDIITKINAIIAVLEVHGLMKDA